MACVIVTRDRVFVDCVFENPYKYKMMLIDVSVGGQRHGLVVVFDPKRSVIKPLEFIRAKATKVSRKNEKALTYK